MSDIALISAGPLAGSTVYRGPEKGDIIVITHNGKLPKDGGKRLGYQTRNMLFLFGGPPEGINLAPQQSASAAQAEAYSGMPVIEPDAYRALKRSIYRDGECGSCGHYPNEPQDALVAGSVKSVIICSNCSKQMRPYLLSDE